MNFRSQTYILLNISFVGETIWLHALLFLLRDLTYWVTSCYWTSYFHKSGLSDTTDYSIVVRSRLSRITGTPLDSTSWMGDKKGVQR
jgi:hypothetical protein